MDTKSGVGRREFLERMAAAGVASVCQPLWAAGMALAPGLPKPGPADWPRFGYDPHNTRFNSREKVLGPENVGRLKLKWSHEIGAPIQTAPAVVGDTLFAGAWDGHYYALDARTGERKWKFDAGVKPEPRWQLRDMKSSAEYNNGRIYFGTGEGDLHSVDAATGAQVWKTKIDPDKRTSMAFSPTVYKDRVFVGTTGDRAQIACVDAETGAIRWRFYIVPDRRDGGGSVWTSAAIDEQHNIVYNVTGNPRSFTPLGPLEHTESILANDLETGELLWHYQVRASDPRDLDFSCHPMIFEAISPGRRGASRHCVGAGSKTAFHTWDRYSGELLWKVMLTNWATQGGPFWNSTATAYNKVYVVSNAINDQRDPITSRSLGDSESVTAALHAYTGEIVWWRHNNSMNRACVSIANGVFYQSLGNGSLEALDAESGKQLWKATIPSTSRGGIVIANGELYTSNGEGGLPTEPKSKYSVFAYSVDGK